MLANLKDEVDVVAAAKVVKVVVRATLNRRVLLGIAGLVVGVMLAGPALRALSPLQPLGGGGHANRNSQGYLGINFRDVSDEQMAVLKLKEARGAEIILVDHDGPGFKSGLREHDVILQMNGQVVEGDEQLRRMLHETPAGRVVNFVLSRDGQQQTLSALLANRDTVGQEAWERHMTVPEPAGDSPVHGSGFFGGGGPSIPEPKHSFLGTTVLNSSYTGALLELMGPQLADYFGAQGGLLVRAVDPNSPAAVAGMRAGDVVLKVNAVPIVSSAYWMKTVHENRGKPLPIVVLRDRKEQILTLTPDTKKRSGVMPHLWPGAKAHPDPAYGFVNAPTWVE
ncbi:PDZ domain-containing protein [Granulicella arctica]|uniref:PDZ domain-containing protein n=1 Tax=Granulicella arctica TaxID=940613 RepID=UPI0021E010ED|nr:PDZ domain-containing protein [Granulicella arctica]